MEELTGYFSKTVFHASDGYTVALFYCEQESEIITVTGYLPEINEQWQYRLTGNFVDHPRYGLQFKIERFENMRFSDRDNLVKYLSSSRFKGIGPKMAESIVDTLGLDLIRKVRENPNVLDEVPKMNNARKLAIAQGIADDKEDTFFFLNSHNLSARTIVKLENHYKDKLMDTVLGNPYQMVYDIDGIGFKTADEFARSLGIADDNFFRLEALLDSCLMEVCMRNGDSYAEREVLQNYFSKMVGSELEYDFDEILESLSGRRRVAMEEERIYPFSQYEAEYYIAEYLSVFPQEPMPKFDETVISSIISSVEEKFGITYQDRQKEAIEAFFTNDLLILTGGPGTGKTTIVRGMVEICSTLMPEFEITLCAPTGRAAKRLKELTGHDARTIHSLLNWNIETGDFSKNEDDPLNTSLLIIDEFSMVDQWVFYNLLRAGAHFKKIIIIGDQDQLPSVGMGSVLRDLIASDLFHVVKLERIYRQKEGSDIIVLANEIKNDTCTEIDTSHEIRFFECSPADVKTLTLQVVEHALNSYDSLADGFMNVQVLVPKHQGLNGRIALNNALQQQFNPPHKGKRELKFGQTTFREGDKILQIKNQPDDDVFNGDIGILTEIIYAREDINGQNRLIVDFEGITVEYTSDNFVNITHGYCITVHKAQGSEFGIVIMPILNEYGAMLQKRLIYTGVTRASSSLIMLGQKEAFFNGIAREDHHNRKTTLQERFAEICGKDKTFEH